MSRWTRVAFDVGAVCAYYASGFLIGHGHLLVGLAMAWVFGSYVGHRITTLNLQVAK